MKHPIHIYPDPVLRTVAEEVDTVSTELKELINDMFAVMEHENGVGLAAPQVGVSKRVIVAALKERGYERIALVNPVIEYSSKEKGGFEEGCLSIPGVRAEVRRPKKIVVKGLGRSGRPLEIEADGLLARVIQHEIDHLNGVLFIDHLTPREKKKISSDLEMLINNQKVMVDE